MISFQEILLVLSDSRTMKLFKVIASTTDNGIITNVQLTRKQYYSRMSELMKTGLIHRKKGKYFLTTFGKIVYDALLNVQLKIEYALTNIWKLRAIDSLAAYEKPSKEELEKIIDALLDNNDIKKVIIKDEYSSSHDLVAEGTQKVRHVTGVDQKQCLQK
jgi:predicted transcriptional regulator